MNYFFMIGAFVELFAVMIGASFFCCDISKLRAKAKIKTGFLRIFCLSPNFCMAQMLSVCARALALNAWFSNYLTIKHYAPCFKLFNKV